MMATLPLIILLVLFVIGFPIGFALMLCVVPYFALAAGIPMDVIIQRFIASTESTSLLAIPFFITAGSIMNCSGITERLLDVCDLLVGHVRGGLGHVNILLSTIMGGLSGSCAADAAQDCKILVPEMLKRGYDEEFSAAITIASSLITPIIPPGMGLLLGFGGSAVGILRTVGLLCLLLAGGKPLVQGGKSGAALGQLLFPVLQGQQPGGSIFQRGQLLFSSGQRCVQCGQLGAFRFGLGSGLGYVLAVLLVTEARHRLRSKAIPKAFRGLPITLVYIGVLALAIYGFTGHSVIL